MARSFLVLSGSSRSGVQTLRSGACPAVFFGLRLDKKMSELNADIGKQGKRKGSESVYQNKGKERPGRTRQEDSL